MPITTITGTFQDWKAHPIANGTLDAQGNLNNFSVTGNDEIFTISTSYDVVLRAPLGCALDSRVALAEGPRENEF